MSRIALAVVVAPLVAHAFTVGTSFTDPCHERITARAFAAASELAFAHLEAPAGAPEALARRYAALLGEEPDPARRWVLVSLVLGVRAPDGEGRSPLDLENSRNLQAAPAAQLAHALRNADDDGADGDERALTGARDELRALVARAEELLTLAPEQQAIDVAFYDQDTGPLTVRVWGPAFFLGRAAHLLQDSFSHALRTDDLRRVRHITNYVEALSTDFSEPRDGLRHSVALDTCSGDTEPLLDGAREASTELFRAGLTRTSVEPVVTRWLQLEPGCTVDDDYCHAPWLDLARSRQTFPALGCSTTTTTTGDALWPSLLALTMLGGLVRERRRSSGVKNPTGHPCADGPRTAGTRARARCRRDTTRRSW